MAEGLEVTIKYSGTKHEQIASTTLSHNAEIGILKKDLGHLRVHSPSQKNVRRVDGSFILHWPTAGTSTKPEETSVQDTLYTRWFKLCGNEAEARKLRSFLSIESITLTQDGRLICSTSNATEPRHQDAAESSLAARLDPPVLQPISAVPPEPPSPSVRPQLPSSPPKPPTGPRWAREQRPYMPKRRLSTGEHPPNPVRRKMDSTTLQSLDLSMDALRSLSNSLLNSNHGTPSRDDQKQESSHVAEPRVPLTLPMGVPSVVPQVSNVQEVPLPIAELLGQSTARIPVPETTRPNLLPRPQSFPRPRTISRPSSNSSGSNVGSHSSHRETVGRLTRELWDTRREVTALQAREKVILDELDTMGARPNTVSSERSLLARDDARVRLSQTEAELRQERVKRLRAERALHDVERECRAPFVVPALFQAFMSLSELSG